MSVSLGGERSHQGTLDGSESGCGGNSSEGPTFVGQVRKGEERFGASDIAGDSQVKYSCSQNTLTHIMRVCLIRVSSRNGRFTFCHQDPDDPFSSEVMLGSAVGLTIDDADGDRAVEYHALVRVEGKDGVWVEEPTRAERVVKVDDMLAPWGFCLQPSRGNPGHLRVSPGIMQSMEETRRRLRDAILQGDDDEDDDADEYDEHDDGSGDDLRDDSGASD